jgi:hypothetical protein
MTDHLAPSDHGSAHPASDRAKALVREVEEAAWRVGYWEVDGPTADTDRRRDEQATAGRALLDYIAELEQRASGGSA